MPCPVCAAELPEDAEQCSECRTDLEERPHSAVKIALGLGCALVVAALGLSLTVLLLVPPTRVRPRASKTRCANRLRQLALGAIQYADDKRFFPHVGKLRQLDGDVATSDAPRGMRTLIYFGYLDDPSQMICPSSDDQAVPVSSPEVFLDQAWFWGGRLSPSLHGESPIVDGAPDPLLSETTELSYGWTRKGMNSNVRSTALLAADRAARERVDPGPGDPLRGNHEGWNVLKVDATVEFFSPGLDVLGDGSTSAGEYLTSTERGRGYLGLKVQADPTKLR